MKYTLRKIMLATAGALALSTSAHAATVTGGGCNNFGTVSYSYVNSGTSLLLTSGGACFASGLTDGEAALLGAMASEAQASGKTLFVGTGASGGGGAATALTVAIQ